MVEISTVGQIVATKANHSGKYNPKKSVRSTNAQIHYQAGLPGVNLTISSPAFSRGEVLIFGKDDTGLITHKGRGQTEKEH